MPPAEFYIGSPKMRKLLAPAVLLDRTYLGQSLSLDQVEEPRDVVEKSFDGRHGRRQRQLSRNLSRKERTNEVREN